MKVGFDYYNVDTDRYQDKRIKRLKKNFGCIGIAVYDYILCEIYRVKGCFLEWDESTAFDVADYLALKEQQVVEIVNYCCHVGLFSKELLASESVLSSISIQTRFIEMSKRAKRINFSIPEKIQLIREKTSKLPEEIPKLPEVFNKGEESKVEKSKKTPLPPEGESEFSFQDFWDLYGKKNDRTKCEAKWKRLKEFERKQAMAMLPAYVRSTPNPQFRKNPLTWLNGKCWNDESLREFTEKKSFVQSLPKIIV